MALTNNHLVKVVKMKKIHSQLMNQSKKMLVLFPFAVVLLLDASWAMAQSKDRPAQFLPEERKIIYEYYHQGAPTRGLPPGLAKRGGKLPPGLQKQLGQEWPAPSGVAEALGARACRFRSSPSDTSGILGESDLGARRYTHRSTDQPNTRHHG